MEFINKLPSRIKSTVTYENRRGVTVARIPETSKRMPHYEVKEPGLPVKKIKSKKEVRFYFDQ